MNARLLIAVLALLPLSAAGCGSGGGPPPRPIEVLYYVSGGPGVRFAFASEEDPLCGSNVTGIQSHNADHQFTLVVDDERVDRIFTTPHLFVLENDRQPVRAAIRNLRCPADQSDPDCVEGPIRVDLYLGQTPQQSNVIIEPGDCRTVAQSGVYPPLPPPTFATPIIAGPDTQVEVCSPQPTPPIGLTTSCVGTGPPPTPIIGPADRNIAYFASIGDIKASNISNCLLPPILDACRSPSTFFVEQPQDTVSAIMSVNPNQNPPGQPTAEVRVELYLNGTRVDSDAGTNPIVSADF